MPYGNFTNKPKFDLLESAKDQEVILQKAERKFTQSGKKYLSLQFFIRDDVEQPNSGRYIFENIWPDKNNPDEFDSRKLQALLLVQGEKGQYDFEDEDELIQLINGFTLRLTVEKKPADEYNDEDYNQVKYCSYKPSLLKPQSVDAEVNASELKQSPSSAPINMEDDESLPF